MQRLKQDKAAEATKYIGTIFEFFQQNTTLGGFTTCDKRQNGLLNLIYRMINQ